MSKSDRVWLLRLALLALSAVMLSIKPLLPGRLALLPLLPQILFWLSLVKQKTDGVPLWVSSAFVAVFVVGIIAAVVVLL